MRNSNDAIVETMRAEIYAITFDIFNRLRAEANA